MDNFFFWKRQTFITQQKENLLKYYPPGHDRWWNKKHMPWVLCVSGPFWNKSTFSNFLPETPGTRCQLKLVIICLISLNSSKILFIKSWPFHYKKWELYIRRRHIIIIERSKIEFKLSLDDLKWDLSVSQRLEDIEVHTIQKESINCSERQSSQVQSMETRRRKNISKRIPCSTAEYASILYIQTTQAKVFWPVSYKFITLQVSYMLLVLCNTGGSE